MKRTLATMTVLLGLASCGRRRRRHRAPDSGDEPPGHLFVEAAPEGAQDVHDLKASDVGEGAEVVVSGKVGGSAAPFSEARAVLTLATQDGHIQSCDTRPGDGCETPWDFCCDPPDAIKANTVTIQVVGKDGRPLKTTLRGAHGIDHLSVLTVKGTVGARPDPNVLVIDATAIHVAQ